MKKLMFFSAWLVFIVGFFSVALYRENADIAVLSGLALLSVGLLND